MAIENVSGSDGSLVTAGFQSAKGVPITDNAPPADNVPQIADDIDIGSNNDLTTFTTFTGSGPLRVTVSAVRNGATLAITDGAGTTETLTYATGDNATKTTTAEFSHTGLTIDPTGWTAGDQADVSVILPDTPGMIQDTIPIATISINETGEEASSNNIRAFGSSPRRRQGRRGSTGGWSADAQFLKIAYMLKAVFGLKNVTSTPVAEQDDVLAAAQALTTRFDAGPSAFSGSNDAIPDVPSKLRITLSAVATTAGTLTIIGKRRLGGGTFDEFQISEVINIDTTETEYLSDTSWSELVAIVPGGGLAGTATYQVDYAPDVYETVMKFNPNRRVRNYLTLGFTKAGIPYTASDVFVRQLDISATEDNTAYAVDCLTPRVDPERTIAGGSARRIAIEAAELTAHFAAKSDPTLSPALTLLEIDGIATSFRTLDVVINLNTDFSTGVTGGFFRDKLSRTDDRLILFNGTFLEQAPTELSDVFTPWETRDRINDEFPVKMTMLGYDEQGAESKLEIETDSAELNESSTTTVDGPSEVDRPVSLKCLSTTAEPSEIVVTLTGPQYTER